MLALKQTATHVSDGSPDQLASVRKGGTFNAEPPNDKVNDYQGQLCLPGQEPVMVARQNVMLRGSQLKSTAWV